MKKIIVSVTSESGELLARLEAPLFDSEKKPLGVFGKALIGREIEKVAATVVREKAGT